MKKGWFYWLAPSLLLATSACSGRYGELCTLADDCEGGNDADYDACIESLETEEEIAEVWGCEEEWDELVACAVEHNDCDNDHFRVDDRCENEGDRYDDCTD